uniref:Uncharacterized protein n=1 Tax=Corvus moneduloides TaxID=1196302 RepID=A0A8C3D645_CORMO
ITCIPLPLHTGHFSTGFETTTCFLPSHFPQMTFFCSASFLVIPLYRSSRDTPNWCTTFLLPSPPSTKNKQNLAERWLWLSHVIYFIRILMLE